MIRPSFPCLSALCSNSSFLWLIYWQAFLPGIKKAARRPPFDYLLELAYLMSKFWIERGLSALGAELTS